MSFNYIIPIIIVIISNLIYHITAKNIPQGANSFLSLIITYLCATIIATAMYFITSKPSNVLEDFDKINWTSYVLGLAVTGVETGIIYMYKAGWNISRGSLVASISLAVLLIIIGAVFFKEHIGVSQVAGIVCCIIGLILINIR